MSQETNVIFTPLRKRCDTGGNATEAENVPFTISSRNLSLDFDLGFGGTRFGESGERNKLTIQDGEYLPDILRDKFDYENLACKPIEEIDSKFVHDETFLVVGWDWKVHRLSAKKSTFIFNPHFSLRRIGILISWNWQLPVLIGIVLCCLCLSFVLPNYASNAVARVVWNSTRYILGGLLILEICANLLARGMLMSEFSYLRSPWEWLDVTTFVIIFLNLYWRSLFLHSLEGVALLKFIPIVPALKTGFQVTIQIFKNLVPALIYSFLTLWILSMVGLHIQSHQIRTQTLNHANSSLNCEYSFNSGQTVSDANNNQYQNESSESTRNYELHLPTSKSNSILPLQTGRNISSSSILNISLHNQCLEDYRLASSPIINLSFQTTNIITFQVLTVPKQVDPLLNHFLYVTLTLIFGTFGVSVLTAASVGFSIFIFPNNSNWRRRQRITCLPRLQFHLPQCDYCAFNKIQQVLFHPFVELFLTTVMCLDIIFMSLTVFNAADENRLSWILKSGQEVCMVVYVVETLAKLCLAPSRYFRSCLYWTLLDCAIAVIVTINRAYPLPILLHFRVLKITSRWPTLQLIFYVFFKSLCSRLSVMTILILGIFCLRFGIANYIHGYNVLNNILPSWMSELFLYNNWTTAYENCQNHGGSHLCFVAWLIEIIFGIVFASVIFVSVINFTCDLVSRPIDCCCENDNYRNLQKAIFLVKSQLKKKCCIFTSGGQSNNSIGQPLNQVAMKFPTQLTIPTSNGGPNNVHYISVHSPPQIIINDTPQSYDTDTQPRNGSQGPSLLDLIRNCQFTQIFSVGIITAAMIASILQFDLSQRTSPYYNPRFFIDLLFVCYFLLILLWKLVKNNFKSLKSPPWLLDFLIVSASGFTLYTSILSKVTIRDNPLVKLVTSLSYFRGLMLVTRLEWLKVGLIGITSEVRVLWRYLIGLLVVWMCLLWLKNNHESFIQKWFIYSPEMSNTTLVTAITKISIKTGLLSVNILLCGVFVGVVIAEFLKTELRASFMTLAQCAIYKDKKLSFHREKTYHIPSPKRGLCRQITHYVTLTHAFDITVMATIICDCLVITFQHLATTKDWQIIWGYYPTFIIFWYACELSMKLIGWRKYFWKSAWNMFDSAIVVIGIIDILFVKIQFGFVTADTIRFLRILRIFQLQIFANNAKFVYICYSSVLRVLPCVGNIAFLYALVLYTFATVGLNSGINSSSIRSSKDMSSFDDFQGVTSALNNIMVSLLSLPFYGNINSFHIAQTHPCWTEYIGIALLIYLYAFTILSHILLGTLFAIVLHEIMQTLSLSQSLYSKHENELPHHRDDVNENKYNHTNGGFLNCDFAKSPDDPSVCSTMLTPIEPLADDDPLGEDDKYPIRMSANGYILHVEAIVTTV